MRGFSKTLFENPNKAALFEGWLSIGVNIMLFVVKLFFGIVIGSLALIADAFHSLGDMATSIVGIVSVKTSQKPSDVLYPYGHGRAYAIAALIVSVLLIVTGTEFGRLGIERYLYPIEIKFSLGIVVLLIGCVLIKEFLTYVASKLAKVNQYELLKAEAYHHRSDSIATGMVILSLVSAKYGFIRLDPLLAGVIAWIILYSGIRIGRQAISKLLGEALPKELVKKIYKLASNIEGIEGEHGVQVDEYEEKRYCCLHIEVSKKLGIKDSHEIADKVERGIHNALDISCVVHTEMLSRGKIWPCCLIG